MTTARLVGSSVARPRVESPGQPPRNRADAAATGSPRCSQAASAPERVHGQPSPHVAPVVGGAMSPPVGPQHASFDQRPRARRTVFTFRTAMRGPSARHPLALRRRTATPHLGESPCLRLHPGSTSSLRLRQEDERRSPRSSESRRRSAIMRYTTGSRRPIAHCRPGVGGVGNHTGGSARRLPTRAEVAHPGTPCEGRNMGASALEKGPGRAAATARRRGAKPGESRRRLGAADRDCAARPRAAAPPCPGGIAEVAGPVR
jgi:hypothetical protein